MKITDVLEIIESFLAGFGKRDDIDIHNAVFIAKELLGLNLPLEFKGAGTLGVESPKLYIILRDAKPKKTNEKPYNNGAFNNGQFLSVCNPRQLMLMASYLWNEGKSSLDESERKEALKLLREKFTGVCTNFHPDKKAKWHPSAKCIGSTDSYSYFSYISGALIHTSEHFTDKGNNKYTCPYLENGETSFQGDSTATAEDCDFFELTRQAQRLQESRQKLSNAFCYCLRVYESHEREKGDSWREMEKEELWKLWWKKIARITDPLKGEPEIETLSDIVNLTAMILARKAEEAAKQRKEQ